ncbi:MAG: FecR family protein [Tannerellaceae bacterium]|jgi:ferric-dicitrate binding protein FerR (iron transport regulator)|nr:FecR family protein [Tannerellaceae bacterium]
MKPYRLHHNINTDRAWERLHNRILNDKPADSRAPNRRIALRRLLPYAAAVVIAAAAFASWRLLSGGNADSRAELLLHNEQGAATLVATLEDGSIVYLGENTRLSYPTHFAAGERKVYLDGNAMFSVEANRERPFRIATKRMTIEVTGTTFDVESNNNRLSVQHGQVKATTTAGNRRSVWVEAGQTARLADGELAVTPTGDDRRLARYMQFLRFKDETLGNILRVINSRGGDASISAAPALENLQITVTFAGNDSAENIARLICNAFEWQLSQPAPHLFIIAPEAH